MSVQDDTICTLTTSLNRETELRKATEVGTDCYMLCDIHGENFNMIKFNLCTFLKLLIQ